MVRQEDVMGDKKGKKSGTEVKKGEDLSIQQATPSRALRPFEELDRLLDTLVPRGWLRPLRWERPWQP